MRCFSFSNIPRIECVAAASDTIDSGTIERNSGLSRGEAEVYDYLVVGSFGHKHEESGNGKDEDELLGHVSGATLMHCSSDVFIVQGRSNVSEVLPPPSEPVTWGERSNGRLVCLPRRSRHVTVDRCCDSGRDRPLRLCQART